VWGSPHVLRSYGDKIPMITSEDPGVSNPGGEGRKGAALTEPRGTIFPLGVKTLPRGHIKKRGRIEPRPVPSPPERYRPRFKGEGAHWANSLPELPGA